jgi:hypothetical protein
MMSECNYLLQSNKLSYDDLLTYLRRRERACISFLEFCIDKSVFNQSVLLDILQHQEINKTLFTESLRVVAGDEFTDDLIKVYYSQIPTIFRFIEYSEKNENKLNVVGAESSEEDLAAISSEEEDVEFQEQLVLKSHNETLSIVPIQHSSEADQSWIFPDLVAEPPDQILVEDFLQTFDEEKKTQMENTIITLKKSEGEQLMISLSLLYRDFHTIKASAGFAKLKVFEIITHELEELISSLKNVYKKISTENHEIVEETLLLGVDILWNLKHAIAEFCSEFSKSEDREWLDKVDRMMKYLKCLKVISFEAQQG